MEDGFTIKDRDVLSFISEIYLYYECLKMCVCVCVFFLLQKDPGKIETDEFVKDALRHFSVSNMVLVTKPLIC